MQSQNKLNSAIAAFEHWRKTRINKHVNIPDELRQQAVDLLEDYGGGQITRALRISSTQLKTWRRLFSVEQSATPDFIALPVEPLSQQASQLSLELSLPNSSKIRICGDVHPDLLRILIQEAGVSS